MSIRAAGLIYGFLEHHLDHLAPFCSLMEIPLVVTERDIFAQASRYYPDLRIIYFDVIEAPSQLMLSYEVIFCSLPKILFDEIFFLPRLSCGKEIYNVWLPHGNSDKGYSSGAMGELKKEKLLLLYGSKMVDFIKSSCFSTDIPPHVLIGNYRWIYYQRHREFYNDLIKELSFPKKKIVLYAPSWEDGESPSFFYDFFSHFLDKVSDEYYLLVKIHPNLFQNPSLDLLIIRSENSSNLCFLKNFPPVYPLLELASHYLGDISSVGYDFLTFNKPMFFLDREDRFAHLSSLYQCGSVFNVAHYSKIIQSLKKENNQKKLRKKRRDLYLHTFGNESDWDKVRKEINRLLTQKGVLFG